MNTLNNFKEFLKRNGIQEKQFSHITLTANQFAKEYSISENYMSTGLHYPKNKINEADFIESEFRINKVWEAVLKN